jgi:hypothetical protein
MLRTQPDQPGNTDLFEARFPIRSGPPANQFELIQTLSDVFRAQSFQSVLSQTHSSKTARSLTDANKYQAESAKFAEFNSGRYGVVATPEHLPRKLKSKVATGQWIPGSNTLPQKPASWQTRLSQLSVSPLQCIL